RNKREKPSLAPPAEVFYLFVMTPHTTTSLQLKYRDVYQTAPHLSVRKTGLNKLAGTPIFSFNTALAHRGDLTKAFSVV
ncbi:unnamed protein product, partial [marine sediment metagenome]